MSEYEKMAGWIEQAEVIGHAEWSDGERPAITDNQTRNVRKKNYYHLNAGAGLSADADQIGNRWGSRSPFDPIDYMNTPAGLVHG